MLINAFGLQDAHDFNRLRLASEMYVRDGLSEPYVYIFRYPYLWIQIDVEGDRLVATIEREGAATEERPEPEALIEDIEVYPPDPWDDLVEDARKVIAETGVDFDPAEPEPLIAQAEAKMERLEPEEETTFSAGPPTLSEKIAQLRRDEERGPSPEEVQRAIDRMNAGET